MGGIGKLAAPEVVKKATVLTAEVIRVVLQKGSLPKWSEYELTGGGKMKIDETKAHGLSVDISPHIPER